MTHSAIASCATFLFLPHFDVICDLLLNRRTATWNLFVKYLPALISIHLCKKYLFFVRYIVISYLLEITKRSWKDRRFHHWDNVLEIIASGLTLVTQEQLVGTKVYFKSGRAPGYLLFPNQSQKRLNSFWLIE